MSGWEGGLPVAVGAGAVSCLGQGRRLVSSEKEKGKVFRGKKRQLFCMIRTKYSTDDANHGYF